jgi:hypothetical protein
MGIINRLLGLTLAYRIPAQEWPTTWIHCGAPILTEYEQDSNQMAYIGSGTAPEAGWRCDLGLQ